MLLSVVSEQGYGIFNIILKNNISQRKEDKVGNVAITHEKAFRNDPHLFCQIIGPNAALKYRKQF